MLYIIDYAWNRQHQMIIVGGTSIPSGRAAAISRHEFDFYACLDILYFSQCTAMDNPAPG